MYRLGHLTSMLHMEYWLKGAGLKLLSVFVRPPLTSQKEDALLLLSLM